MTKNILRLSLLFSFLGLALITPASAETTVPTAKPAKAKIDLVCMQNALTKRHNSVITSLHSHQESIKNSLEKRRNGLVENWKIEDRKERARAMKNISSNFKKERVASREDYHKSRISAWTTYKAERKACGGKSE